MTKDKKVKKSKDPQKSSHGIGDDKPQKDLDWELLR